MYVALTNNLWSQLSATWSVPLPARAQSPKLSEDSASGLEQREYSALMGGGRTGIGSISTGHRSALSANIGYGLSDEIGSGRNSLVPSYAPMYPASPTTESRLQRIGSLDTNIRFNQAHTNTIPVHYRHVNPRPTTSETQHIHYHQQQQNKIDPLGANVVHNSNPSIVTTQGALLGLREDYDSQKEKFLPSHSLSLSWQLRNNDCFYRNYMDRSIIHYVELRFPTVGLSRNIRMLSFL